MGRTIASITQTWQQEEAALNRFKRALRKEDQLLLDELLVLSRLHLAEASYASNLYPLDMYLIAILLEVYKQLKATQKELHSDEIPQIKLAAETESAFFALLNNVTSASTFVPEGVHAQAQPQIETLPEAKTPVSYVAFEEAP